MYLLAKKMMMTNIVMNEHLSDQIWLSAIFKKNDKETSKETSQKCFVFSLLFDQF